jgi:hypothetical protein
MSPALHQMVLVRDMQNVLRCLENIDMREHRATAYVLGGFTDFQVIQHDREAYRTETIRRRIFGEQPWKASQSAYA